MEEKIMKCNFDWCGFDWDIYVYREDGWYGIYILGLYFEICLGA